MSAENIEDIYELSAVQEGILFHSIHNPDSGMYIVQMECLLLGHLDSAAFERAWQRLVDAYSILRTSFVWENVAQPLQVVQQEITFTLFNRDWTDLSADAQETCIDRYLEEDRRCGFDLAHAPLMRAALFRVDDDAHRFVWTHHHILLDGWSVGLVLNAVLQFYKSEIQDVPSPALPSCPFSSYIDWLNAQDASRARDFWSKRLRGFLKPIQLGVDQVLSVGKTTQGRILEQNISLSQSESMRLTKAANHHGLTLATLAQAAWGLLLSRYSGVDEVVFGSTVSARPTDLAGSETIIGPCINTIPVRLNAKPSLAVMPWLMRLQDELIEAMVHCHANLVDIQQASEIPSGIPLFESVIAVENYPVDLSLRERGGELHVRNVRWFGSTNYPLACLILLKTEITIIIQYDISRFSMDVVSRMLHHYRQLLRGILHRMKGTVGSIEMLTTLERRQLLVNWNATEALLPRENGVHELFEAQAQKKPKAWAVSYGQSVYTYEELNHCANQLANYLQDQGVDVGSLVGVLIDHSFELLIALLGVWKAGGAFLPLDPGHPKERTSFMLSNANVSWVLTKQQLLPQLPQALKNVILLDADWPKISKKSIHDINNKVTPSDLAYVLYTSGSTGTPKGVKVVHRGLLNYIVWCIKNYSVENGAGSLTYTSIAFDLTFTSIFAPLVVGKCVTILRQERGVNALVAALHDRSRSQPFSLVKLTPSHIKLLGECCVSGYLEHSTLVFVVGGEALNAEHITIIRDVAPGAAIFNEYGPTETVIGCCVYQVPETFHHEDPILIGRPIDNTQLYILDKYQSPLPIGVPGELCIGGEGLALGYLNRPDLTAERFISHPFDRTPGTRLYRTGDKARYLPDGNIEYLGRLDQQIKIRGFRIETAEIQVVLESHPSVDQSVVIVRKNTAEETELVVCWVPLHTAEVPSSRELYRFLQHKLPEPMVPNFFTKFQSFPLTSNGKIDLEQLAKTTAELARIETNYVAPKTPVEKVLVEIWKNILCLECIGVQDDFFELGGHSLSALRILSQTRARFAVDLTLEQFFEARTIETLGSLVKLGQLAEVDTSIPRRQSFQKEVIPASFFQQRLWLLNQLNPDSPVYNINNAVQIEGPINVPLLEQSLKQVVVRHEILRTTFAISQGQVVQLIASVSDTTILVKQLPLVGLSMAARRLEAKEKVVQCAREAFDLEKYPLLRVILLSIHAHEHILLISMHHIISDGWSRNLLVNEIIAHYEGRLSGGQVLMPKLPIQYADFSVWQRARVEGSTGTRADGLLEEAASGSDTIEAPC